MNIDNEILINAFKEEMARSNHNSKWWSEHLSDKITEIFGSNLDSGIKDEIMKSAQEYIDSGFLSINQYLYTTKELSDKKEIFAAANMIEKRNIFIQIQKEDKIAVINNNAHLKLKDIYDILTSDEFKYSEKKEMANLLDENKIKNLKENYFDLNESLKDWLGPRYEQIFGKEEVIVEQKSEQKNNIVENYIKATDKITFFNSITDMQDKQNLFNNLDDREKKNILNNNNKFLGEIYKNYQNKNELLGLLNESSLKNLYNMSGIQDKEFISQYLTNYEQNLKNSINNNLNGISKETENINKYRDNIKTSKENIHNSRLEKVETKLNIKKSQVKIKLLEKRKERLEQKLANSIVKSNNRISFIAKRRLKKIQNISSNINANQQQLENYEQQLNKIDVEIKQEKKNIKDNKYNISLANEHIRDYAKQMYNSRVQAKELSSFHKKLISKKTYNHNKNNIIMTTSKTKTNTISSANNTQANTNNLNISQSNPNIISNNNDSIKPSKVSQNQEKLKEEFNKLGITYHQEEYVSKEQNASFLPPQQITSMSHNEAKMMQLYFEAEYAKKMVEIAKLQQQMAMSGGRSRTLSSTGFSNILFLTFSLSLLMLLGTLLFFFFK